MPTGSRRTRGRPPKTVSPVATTPPTPAAPPVKETEEPATEPVNKPDVIVINQETSKNANDSETLKTEKENEEPRKLWVDVISGNRNPAKGRTMMYVPPTIVNGEVDIVIEEAGVESELRFWENALILYMLGEDLSMHALKSFMLKAWNFIQLPDLFYHDDGYFILRFKTHDDMDVVLMRGPYTICNIPMLLREWRPDFNLKTDLLRTLPIWVKLPQLHLHLWGATSLNKIGSAIGIPLVTNECTMHKLRVSYARILVEIDITQKLLDEITITDNEGRKTKQPKKKKDEVEKPGHNRSEIAQPETSGVKDHTENLKKPEEEEGIWTPVSKAVRDRGKGTVQTDSSASLQCINGFGALGALNGAQNPYD
ncbi:uncharacterized protein LOC131618903 [Vicia villosa]|uniref:uncharacterized protein LOC131618903 n=1 Tax=Vicia villosa TaxID=3911 RepID=UPI00273B24C9|nr:uncharacterized protein LOC131618903 [Vicia villosa]